jgi:hypothetical protein
LKNEGNLDELAAESARVEVYKLILNAIYGFTIVNSDKHREAELFDVKEDKNLIRRRISSPRFLGMLNVGEKVVVNQMKTAYTLDYPLMIGSAILFESKLLTANYIFHLYDWLKGTDMELHPCFYDTDSCCISIQNLKKIFQSINLLTSSTTKSILFLTHSANVSEYQMPETHGIRVYD